MKLIQVKEILNAQVYTNQTDAQLHDMDINSACGADLMSDVLAYVKDHGLLLTGLVNTQVIRTAEMMDITAICFVRGKVPNQEIIELAEKMNIAILGTTLPLYVSCGQLYASGLVCQ